MAEDVNEVSEMWRDHRKYLKRQREKRRGENTESIRELPDAPTVRGRKVVQLTPYHFRVDGFLDLFPTNCRFHNLKTGKRGQYPFFQLKKFVDAQLKEAGA